MCPQAACGTLPGRTARDAGSEAYAKVNTNVVFRALSSHGVDVAPVLVEMVTLTPSSTTL